MKTTTTVIPDPGTRRRRTRNGLPTEPPRWVDLPEVSNHVDALVSLAGADPTGRPGRIVADLVRTALKLPTDGRNTGELKLLTNSFKELRHALRVFAPYRATPKISIFGSARTPPEHPDYLAAVEFSRLMADAGWLVITGAGDGIMKAGHEGPGRDSSFGLSIRLPFETTANSVIAGDHKLLGFRYFFTRKLMFLSQSAAVAAFPGGFGTQDELMETLTLMQTGKSPIVPIVLIAGPGRTSYWDRWVEYVREEFLDGGFISPDDLSLFHVAATPADAVEHVLRFYSTYHSARYVGDVLVLRIRHRLTDEQVDALNDEFAPLVRSGRIEQRGAFDVEDDVRDLPRLAFGHTQRSFGAVRQLIDRVNEYGTPTAESGLSFKPHRR